MSQKLNVEIKRYNKDYRNDLLKMMKVFWNSPAVLHKIPGKHFETTIDMLDRKSDFTDCYILLVDGKSVGYVLLSNMYSQEAGGLVVWIEELFVDDSQRGKGLSKMLMNFVMDKNEEAKRFRLEATEQNKVALKLYDKFGYSDLDYVQLIKDI